MLVITFGICGSASDPFGLNSLSIVHPSPEPI